FTSMSVLRVFQTSLFISPLIIYVIVSLIVLSLTSCGKGSKNGSEQATANVLSIAGIFSDGAPVDGGIVVVRDSNGKTFQTLTDENGIYSFVAPGLKPPYLLKGTYSKIENPTPYNYAKEIIHEKSIYSFVPKEGFQNSDILETNKDENGVVAIAHINSLSNVLVSVSGDKVLSTEELDNIITGSKDAVTFDPSNWTTILSLIQSQLCPLASAEDQAKKCSDLDFLSTPYAMNKEDKVYKLLNSIFPKISETGNESEISYLDANEVTVVSLGSQHYIEQHIPDDAELTVDKVAQVEQAQDFSNLPVKITNELKYAINPGQNSGSEPTAEITSPTQVSAPQMPVNTAPTNTYVAARIAFDQEKAKAAIQLLTESECPITISSFRVNPVDNILSSSFGKTPDYNNNRITDFDINFNGDLPGGNFEVSAYKSCKPFTFEYEFDYALNIQAKVLELPTDDGEIVRSLKKRFEACNGFANSQTEELLIKLLVAEHSVYTGGSFAGGSRSSSVDGSQISYKVAPMHYRGRFSSSEAGFQVNDNCINRKSVKFVPLNDTGVTYTIDSMVGEVVYSYQNYATGIFEEKNIFRPLIFPASGTEGRFTSVLHYIDSYGRDAVFTN
ncbi:MAG: carboxypeptidase-like regulatory domain-containing protein, partial [Gammaproteobacteria bacterium]|nr:carboxypeptidase-like regulatory domain-containing protein [Gammaproteobacteria bacterium]